MADKVLQAYAYSILAKDASGRWSNPRRALRNYEDIMEVAGGSDIKESMKDTFASAIKEAVSEATGTTQEAPKVEKTKPDPQYMTKKMFYDFKADMIAEFKKLAPPVTP